MTIRGLRPEDEVRLKELHSKMQFSYPFPKLQIHDVGKAVVDAGDGVVMAALAVPIVECYLLMDPSEGTPGERHGNLLRLHQAMRLELKERGYKWATSDIPPEVEKSFGKRLARLGWIKGEWASFAVEV